MAGCLGEVAGVIGIFVVVGVSSFYREVFTERAKQKPSLIGMVVIKSWTRTIEKNHPSASEMKRAQGQPVGVGLGQSPADSTIIAEWNDRESVERAFVTNSHEISAIICEPLLCTSGCIPPADGFLQFLRDIASDHYSLLIFDEVITGFRLALGGAQEFYGVVPDLATFAKAVGGGAPLSVLAGKAEYIDWISNGQVIHAGTLNGNPLSLAAAKAALDILAANGASIYSDLRERGKALRSGLEELLRAHGVPVVTNG